ncbi:hypothetical protein A3A14_01560 [Candidatus Daviesbacteria bacterium RIFCSPLOWO2_01_FULL_43_38]|uniref:GH10 domain-containing protein n=1 Tax=Candidatus Daviesbacteria bacterium RIFCSPHIGHO2_12_FULL_43_11 TaxID=1797780 RepID=A0A1F5K2G5_9BACT|nr:MAG: hypothetical protein A2874_01320 [Candidatus Daviesbacteria bacterium RIFCSPHIGHO2_01_FULL_43_17]OGE34901.1 MAG: hypothetical protein A3E45_04395 [Candidatus Daviesbacteria bacterium RIFCSPHIGHO2_12_FULL_43_11]OGE63879.1 MAG: hypothetical protein A3A14_01560 [Candidatus Daviesbacteria bacterium RIFCSPLOWO2_01_FULL_43_38]
MRTKTKIRLILHFLLGFITVSATAFALLWLTDFFMEQVSSTPRKITYGVTFSAPYARYLGLDPEKVLESINKDLNVKLIRIPVYWDEVEKEPGVYDFSTTDRLLDIAKTGKQEVILVIGYKVPRWPECFSPAWVKEDDQSSHQEKILQLLKATVTHFQNQPKITAWQVENEPLLPFGECKIFDEIFLKKEVELVKSLDSRPVVLTDSGELGLWIQALRYSDLMGTSLYRTVYDPRFGFFTYPFPALYYNLKAIFTQMIFAPNSQGVFISELQAEPWALPDKPLIDTPIDKQAELFPLKKLQETVHFTARTGIEKQYLWGVEWWYYMKVNGHPEYWEYAKTLF